MKLVIKKTMQILFLILLGIVILLVFLNIYGRSHFNPKAADISEKIEQPKLNPGKNAVYYFSEGSKISAFLFLPEDYEEGQKRPAIVVTPPHTGVKEQTGGIYAEELSKKGYVTLVFDPRGFGESEGHSGYLSSFRQREDIKNSVDFIISLDAVDQDRVYNLGMCAGSGGSAYETMDDPRIKAQVIVSPYLTGSRDNGGNSFVARNMFYVVNGFAKALHATVGKEIVRPLVPTTEAAAEGANPITKGMMTYYLPSKPGDVPTWSNDLTLFSLVPVIDFSIFEYSDRFESMPFYIVYGSEAVSKDGAEMLYDQLTGPKERLIVEGAGHFELYWMPEYVDPAVEGIDNFLKKY